jgi:hypothetical protein
MSFLYPAFLIGALAIAIPVVLHFLRRDIAPEIPFSAVRLLRRSPVARSRRRRLRDLLLLAARIAALLLLAAAFARPYRAGATASSAVRIVAVDRSFSMGAPGRFARALDLARNAVEDAPAGERVAVIGFDDNADVLAPPGGKAEAQAALANLLPGFGSTKYGALFAKASEIAGTASGSLIVVTDLQRAGWEGDERAVLPAALALEVRATGAPVDNVSVVAVRTEADRVIASVHNSGARPRRGQVRVERDGTPTATVPYTAEPDATVEVPIPYRVPPTGAIAVSVDDQEGFAADNTRYAVLDRSSYATVLVVTSGAPDSGFYLGRALAATAERGDQRMDAQVATSASLGRKQDEHEVEFGSYSAVVLLSTRALERRVWESIAAFVRSGGGLVIAASPDVDPVVLSSMFNWRPALDGAVAVAAGKTLSPTDLRHPIFRPFGTLSANLGQVHFERTWRVTTEDWDMIARFADGSPALIERREGLGRVVVFASDFDRRWNDFPLHPAFVPFALETVRYVSAVHDRGREYLVGSSPAGAEARPGVYQTAADGRTVAVNVDIRESAASALRLEDFVSKVERVPAPGDGAATDARAQQVEARQGYWQYGLLLMLAALVAESFVGRA